MITRLAILVYYFTIVYLKGCFASWKKSGKDIDTIRSISADELADIQKKGEVNILDVRKKSEYDSEHLLNAENMPLDVINEHMPMLDRNKTYYVHCAGGYRSMIFNSTLRARGYDNLVDIHGGFKAIKDSGNFKISEYVCPTTML